MLLYSKWLAIPLHVRAEIATKFGVAKTGPTHVQDNRVVSDGYKIQDVENSLTMDSIQAYLGVKETDINTLFDLLVARIEGREVEPELVEEETPVSEEETPVAPIPKEIVKPKRKYTKKK